MSELPSKEPRVLHFISSSGFLGAENVVLELAKESSKQGYWVAIGILENRNNLHMELAESASSQGIRIQIFPCKNRFDWEAVSSIRTYIKTEQPNLLHSHGYKGNFYALAANRKKLPWIVTNHLWKKTTVALKLYAYLDSLLIRHADRIVAVSDEIASEMMKKGISPQKIIVIDNGVDVERFALSRNEELRKSFGFNGSSKVVGTIASLTPEKGHVYLLEAARKVVDAFPGSRFLIVGDGVERHMLEEKTADLGLTGEIFFAGIRRDVPEILSILDLFVLPSLKEGLPMALLEAQAARLPVVATRVGAVPAVVVHEKTGLLVKPGDANSLSTSITQLLGDVEKGQSFGLHGFERVRAQFSAKAMSDRYFKLYDELLFKRS